MILPSQIIIQADELSDLLHHGKVESFEGSIVDAFSIAHLTCAVGFASLSCFAG